MIPLALAGIAAQLLDLGTWHPSTEINPLVNALGGSAPMVKVAGVALVLGCAYLLRRSYGRVVLEVLIAVGCVGALSNVLARLG